jgi:hypothetical protein
MGEASDYERMFDELAVETQHRSMAEAKERGWVTEDFVIVQRLALLMTYAKHLAGLQTATVLTTLYLTRLQLRIPQLIAFDRDSVAANGVTVRCFTCPTPQLAPPHPTCVARFTLYCGRCHQPTATLLHLISSPLICRSLRTTFTSATDILCCSHTVCNAGKRLTLGHKDEFMSKWIGIVYGNSPAAFNLWRRTIDQSVIGFSAVRWYCTTEIEFQIVNMYPLMRPFLIKLVNDDLCPTLAPAALAIYDRDPLQLKVEFAATMDVKMLVTACYNLEGTASSSSWRMGFWSRFLPLAATSTSPATFPTPRLSSVRAPRCRRVR